MKRSLIKTLGLLVLAAACPAFAEHGTLMSNDRDSWINNSVYDLTAAGLIPAPAKSSNELSNLEVAQLVAQAGNALPLPGMDPGLPPALPSSSQLSLPGQPLPNGLAEPGTPLSPLMATGVRSLKQLVAEFHDELAAMGADIPEIEDRIVQLEHNNATLAELQKEYLSRTGTQASGYTRGYMNEYRGFGNNALYGPAVFNADIFGELDLKSVPVPSVVFDGRFRFWRTIGLYYQDPIAKNGGTLIDLRWISLSDFNPYVNVTAGDFLKQYTPLTLWNYDVPVYTMIEPTSYYRTRKDVEDMVSMNYGNDWRLRGFQAFSTVTLPKNPVMDDLQLQAMAGPINAEDPFHYGSYFGGSEGSLHFFDNNLELKAAGIMLWDDTGTANQASVLYTPKEYQIGSWSSQATIPFTKDINVAGSVEGAGSQYQDNLNKPDVTFTDWAFRGTGAINIYGFHLSGKYLNVGPYFYSPGAQTNRYTPAIGAPGYFNDDNYWEDEAIVGYLNNYPFQGIQGVGRPYYAPYDRMSENVLPYGDATPNREGFIGGLSVDIGRNGWIKPQVSYTAQMREVQPNWVVNNLGVTVAVDSTTNTAVARTFGGYEGALTLDFAKAFDMVKNTYKLSFDYKNQTTDLGLGASPFTVDTFITAADFNIPFQGFDTVVLSLAFEQAKSSGDEYVLSGVGDPPTLASYSFYLNSGDIGSYSYQALNITRTSWSFGFMYPLSKTVQFRGDYFINQYTWSDVPSYDRREDIWRFTYEAHF